MQENFDSPSYRDLYKFCVALPKVELHAHLNGSLSAATLRELQGLRGTGAGTEVSADAVAKYAAGGSDWITLGECFALAHTLTDTPAAVSLATRSTLREFSRDGCVYAELRSAPRATPAMTRAGYIQAVLQGIRENTEPIAAAYIVSLDRAWSLEVVTEVTDLAIEYHGRYPDVVIGLDLSGNPSLGRFRDFVPALTKAMNAGLKLSVHCAEVANPTEVEEIINFKPHRLGHGTCIAPETGGTPALWRALIESRIPVELCLTSNAITKSVSDYDGHHFSLVHAAEHPLCLCTDDAGIFSTSLSREYAICGTTYDLSRDKLAQLSLRSAELAFCSERQRRELRDAIVSFCKKENLEMLLM